MNRINETPVNPDFKRRYRLTFSQISPSEATEERIMSMINPRAKRSVGKIIAVMAVIIAFIVCATLIAEAATNGAVSRGISQAASDAVSKISKEIEIEVIENGKNVSKKADVHKETQEDGTEVYVYKFQVGDDAYAEIATADDTPPAPIIEHWEAEQTK